MAAPTEVSATEVLEFHCECTITPERKASLRLMVEVPRAASSGRILPAAHCMSVLAARLLPFFGVELVFIARPVMVMQH